MHDCSIASVLKYSPSHHLLLKETPKNVVAIVSAVARPVTTSAALYIGSDVAGILNLL